MLISFDPGLSKLGLASFEDGALADVRLIQRDQSGWQDARAWVRMLQAVQSAGAENAGSVAYEMMQKDGRTQGASVQSMMQLCGVIGSVVTGLVHSPKQAHGYRPSQWNKNRPKGPNHAKILRTLDAYERDTLLEGRIYAPDGQRSDRPLVPKRLRPFDTLYESAVDESVGQVEHVLDAVGIGLHHLGRLR